jgi:hypothetical protein
MNLPNIFLNEYFASIFIIGMSFLIYHELKKPWGLILPIIALLGVIILICNINNSGINYIIIGGVYGFLLSISEWIKTKFFTNNK